MLQRPNLDASQPATANSGDLRGLQPVNNFDPTLFLGNYYEQLRLLPNEKILFGIGLEGTHKHPWTNVTWAIVPRKSNAQEPVNVAKLSTTIRGYNNPSNATPITPVTGANLNSTTNINNAVGIVGSAGIQTPTLSQLVNQLPGFAQGVSDQLNAMNNANSTNSSNTTNSANSANANKNVVPLSVAGKSVGTWKTRSASLDATGVSGVYNSRLGDFGWLVPEKYVILDAGYISSASPSSAPQTQMQLIDGTVTTATSPPAPLPSGPYDYIIIGTPNRNNLWLLTRSATALTPALQQQYLKVAQTNNWPSASLQRLYTVPQTAAPASTGMSSVTSPLNSVLLTQQMNQNQFVQFEPSMYGQDAVSL